MSSFDIDRLAEDEAAQIGAMRSIGYTGLVVPVRFENQLELLKRYQAIIGDDPFEIYGGYLSVILDAKLDEQNAHIDNILKVLKKSGGSLCVILHLKNPEQKRAEATAFLRSAAERTKAAGIELVIFPHVGERYLVKSAEDALPYIEEIKSDNIFVALHLSHELMAGKKRPAGRGGREDEAVDPSSLDQRHRCGLGGWTKKVGTRRAYKAIGRGRLRRIPSAEGS